MAAQLWLAFRDRVVRVGDAPGAALGDALAAAQERLKELKELKEPKDEDGGLRDAWDAFDGLLELQGGTVNLRATQPEQAEQRVPASSVELDETCHLVAFVKQLCQSDEQALAQGSLTACVGTKAFAGLLVELRRAGVVEIERWLGTSAQRRWLQLYQKIDAFVL